MAPVLLIPGDVVQTKLSTVFPAVLHLCFVWLTRVGTGVLPESDANVLAKGAGTLGV